MKNLSVIIIIMVLCLMTVSCTADPQLPEHMLHENATDSAEVYESTSETFSADFSENMTSSESVPVDGTPSVGGFTPCVHTVMYGTVDLCDAFHTVPGVFGNYVGLDAFNEFIDYWEANRKHTVEKTSCGQASVLLDFIEYFQITKEEFEKINERYLKTTADYNVDAIYGGIEAADAYYASDRLQTVLEKTVLSRYKGRLILYVNQTAAEKKQTWLTEKTEALQSIWKDESLVFRGDHDLFCLPEIISYFDISRETAEKLYNEVYKAYSDCERTLDFDAIYKAASEKSFDSSARIPADFDFTFFVSAADAQK